MLSLENLKRRAKESEAEAIARWLAKAAKAAGMDGDAGGVVAEPKLDGLSVSLRYEGGALVQGATRGDGTQGDDVTANVAVVDGVATALKTKVVGTIEVRGEVLMRKAVFERLQLNFTTARNAAAGSLRLRDAAEASRRELNFVAHDVEGLSVDYSEKRRLLSAWGFQVAEPSLHLATIDEAAARLLAEYHASARAKRSEMESEIDGVVYKLDSFAAREACGATAKAPRWAVAHKFDDGAALAATALVDVRVSVGKRGTLTPIAVLDAVRLGDVEVQSATLHNAANVRRVLRGLRRGQTVWVRRAGDVIPQLAPRDVPEDGPPGDFDDWEAPATCPSCGAPTILGDDGERFCPASFDCRAQATERLAHFVSRRGCDLEGGVGRKRLQQLVDHGLIRSAADLLALDDDDIPRLAALDGWGIKSAAKLVGAVRARRRRPLALAAFLFAMGVPRVGWATAATLAANTGSWPTLWTVFCGRDDNAADDRDRLARLPGIGPAVIEACRAFAFDPDERAVVDRCAALLVISETGGPG